MVIGCLVDEIIYCELCEEMLVFFGCLYDEFVDFVSGGVGDGKIYF